MHTLQVAASWFPKGPLGYQGEFLHPPRSLLPRGARTRHERTMLLKVALVAALAAAGEAAFDACGTPEAGPVLGGVDVVDAWAKALGAQNGPAPPPGAPRAAPGRALAGAEAPPLKGSAEHVFTTKDGFAFHFATPENRDAYASDPTKYPLGAGGYCGLGASGRDPRCPGGGECRGLACGTSPVTFQISGVDGKLYFFLGAGARSIFNEDEAASVEGASAKVQAVEEAAGHACFNTDLLGCRTPGMAPGGGNASRAGGWRQRLNQGLRGPEGMAGQRGPQGGPGGQQRPGMPGGGQRPAGPGGPGGGGQHPGGPGGGGGQHPGGPGGPGGGGQHPGGPGGPGGPRGGGGGASHHHKHHHKPTAWEAVKAVKAWFGN